MTDHPRPTHPHDWPPPPGADPEEWVRQLVLMSPRAEAATAAARRLAAGDTTVIYSRLMPDGTFELNPDYREEPPA